MPQPIPHDASVATGCGVVLCVRMWSVVLSHISNHCQLVLVGPVWLENSPLPLEHRIVRQLVVLSCHKHDLML